MFVYLIDRTGVFLCFLDDSAAMAMSVVVAVDMPALWTPCPLLFLPLLLNP